MRLPVWLKEGNSPTTDCDINSTNCVQSEMKKKQKKTCCHVPVSLELQYEERCPCSRPRGLVQTGPKPLACGSLTCDGQCKTTYTSG